MSISGLTRVAVCLGLAGAQVLFGLPTRAQDEPGQSHLLYAPGAEVTCENQPVAPRYTTALVPVGARDLQASAESVRHEIHFSIGLDGRPRDIATPPTSGAPLNERAAQRNEATLAGWRFDEGARSGCRMTIAYSASTIEDAPVSLLGAYYGDNRIVGPLRETVGRRLAGADAACEDTAEARRHTTPDFNAPGKRPGVQDWTVVRWSTSAAGQVQDVEILASSGSDPFDAGVVSAMGSADLTPDAPRKGCIYNWYRRGLTVAAPEMPVPPADEDRRCPASVLASWRPNPSSGPDVFRERGIEGWALVRFDIAPWGEVGNVQLIDAQPAKAFGEAAVSMVRRGRAWRGEGAIGCVQPIEFRIPE